MFCVHSAAVLCGREATHLAMSQFIPFMSLPWEIFVLKPSRSWLGFTLGGECSRVQVGGRRRKMGPWWAGTGMPDVPVRNGPKLRAAFLPPLSWHHRWQTCKCKYGKYGKYPPEEGQITRLPESACDIVNFFLQIHIFRMWGESGLNFLCKIVVNI